MEKITSCIWFDKNAEEAVAHYQSVFKDVEILDKMYYGEEGKEITGGEPGSVLTVEFTIAGQHFTALNGGPIFAPTPALSFTVCCSTEEEIDALWKGLSDGGMVMMPLQEYPYSKKYGWLSDKFGVSWQLNLTESDQKIIPSMLFVGEVAGKAHEAMELYTSLFENGKIHEVARYEPGEGTKDDDGTVKYALFTLEGQKFIAMDSAYDHKFAFNEGVSFVVNCKTQEEVDQYWNAFLESGGEESQCGWLKDRFGVSWQIVPVDLNRYLADADPAKAARAMRAMLGMKKIDMAEIERAYEGK